MQNENGTESWEYSLPDQAAHSQLCKSLMTSRQAEFIEEPVGSELFDLTAIFCICQLLFSSRTLAWKAWVGSELLPAHIALKTHTHTPIFCRITELLSVSSRTSWAYRSLYPCIATLSDLVINFPDRLWNLVYIGICTSCQTPWSCIHLFWNSQHLLNVVIFPDSQQLPTAHVLHNRAIP